MITNEKPLVRSEASGLLKSFNRLETTLMMELWCDILDSFETVSYTHLDVYKRQV